MPPAYQREPWLGGEQILIHGSLDKLRGKPPTHDYRIAKGGGDDQLAATRAASIVVHGCIDRKLMVGIYLTVKNLKVSTLCVVAPFRKPEDTNTLNHNEFSGNAIGITFARFTANFLSQKLPHISVFAPTDIAQITAGRRTSMNREQRFLVQACFEGPVIPDAHYLIVDDVVTTGGALAQLRSHIIRGKAHVVGAMALAYADGKTKALAFAPQAPQLTRVRNLYGNGIDKFWRKTFGHDLACITSREAKRLIQIGKEIKECDPGVALLDGLRDRLCPP